MLSVFAARVLNATGLLGLTLAVTACGGGSDGGDDGSGGSSSGGGLSIGGRSSGGSSSGGSSSGGSAGKNSGGSSGTTSGGSGGTPADGGAAGEPSGGNSSSDCSLALATKACQGDGHCEWTKEAECVEGYCDCNDGAWVCVQSQTADCGGVCPAPEEAPCGGSCTGDVANCQCACGGPNYSGCSCTDGEWACLGC